MKISSIRRVAAALLIFAVMTVVCSAQDVPCADCSGLTYEGDYVNSVTIGSCTIVAGFKIYSGCNGNYYAVLDTFQLIGPYNATVLQNLVRRAIDSMLMNAIPETIDGCITIKVASPACVYQLWYVTSIGSFRNCSYWCCGAYTKCNQNGTTSVTLNATYSAPCIQEPGMECGPSCPYSSE